MRVRHELPERAPERVQVLGIGFFDGVHRGHREILRALGRLRRPGETVAALTFREHPAAYLRPGSEPPLITTLEERIALLAEAGVDELYVLAFDARIAALDASAFLREVLQATRNSRPRCSDRSA
jgi:riboflavin kinase/FMN adenylyltransferase